MIKLDINPFGRSLSRVSKGEEVWFKEVESEEAKGAEGAEGAEEKEETIDLEHVWTRYAFVPKTNGKSFVWRKWLTFFITICLLCIFKSDVIKIGRRSAKHHPSPHRCNKYLLLLGFSCFFTSSFLLH